MSQAIGKFDAGRIKMEDLDRSGGAPEETEA